ncbi:MAG TPA: ABC transporter transmembrane domain-containing protein [Burkholderiaceae bacterium]|jgi:ATP-binding cassette subfamily B protein|nr:ABC transporter transmembrane domain-containing protein [Burkholderiaceae bacterium]
MSDAAPARSSLAVLRGLAPFLRPYRWRVIAAGVALLVASIATLAIPVAFRQLIDVGFAARTLQSEVTAGGRHVDAWFLGLFAVASVLALGTAVRFYFVSWLGERVTADLRSAVYSRVLRQDPIFFESLRGGEVVSRLTADTTLIQTLVGTSVSMGLRNFLLFIGGLVMLLATSARLASLIVGLLFVVIVPILLFGRRVRKLSRASQDRIADSSALAGETLSAIQIVQAYAREAFEAARFRASAEEAFQAAVRRTRARSILTALAIVLVFGAIVFVLWLGAQAVLQGRMSAGELTQFILYAAIVAGSVGALSEVMGDVQRAAGAAERLLELLAAQPHIVGPDAARMALRPAQAAAPVTGRQAGAAVSFDAVNFHYPSRPAEPALVDLNLSVEPGQTIALVGPSGAGKTTVFSLLLRFYDPQSGSIRLDGVDLRDFEPTALRERIGLVSQDSVVFSADVMENIRYGRLEASDDEVRAAAAAAHADEFIDRLPQGYQTYVGERGVRLSGGQRQRIAIARALLKNPPLLLLDEATSALDAQSEQAVQLALEQAMRGRTTLVIAHRLATITGADRIVVFERGRLVDTGTHAELVARGGLYARLAAMQFTQ